MEVADLKYLINRYRGKNKVLHYIKLYAIIRESMIFMLKINGIVEILNREELNTKVDVVVEQVLKWM